MAFARPVLIALHGQEAVGYANAILQMTLMVRKIASRVLVFGPGVEIFRANQKNSPAFRQLLDGLCTEGVALNVCEMFLENPGLTADQMFPAGRVKGGVEIVEKLAAF